MDIQDYISKIDELRRVNLQVIYEAFQEELREFKSSKGAI